VSNPDSEPTEPGFIDLLRAGGRWWMWLIIAAVVLAVTALITLQALEYLAPFIYVAI
jgi:hypothetical protein